jgi:hypothetical protein
LNPDQTNGIQIKGIKYNVVRIHGACSPRIAFESTADLIPIQVWGENPTLEGPPILGREIGRRIVYIKPFSLRYYSQKRKDPI